MDQQTTSGSANLQEVPAMHNACITGSEVACLWTTFEQYTLWNCIFGYLERTVQDPAAKEIISDLMPVINYRVRFAADVFQREGIPIPLGFTEQDVNLAAPQLYSDGFVLHFLRKLTQVNMTINVLNLSMAARPDIRDFYSEMVRQIIDVNTQITDLMLAQGILPRSPYLSVALEIERVHQTSFLAGFLGEKRPLLTAEVAHIYLNAFRNEVGKGLLLGFRQVSGHREVQDYFGKGIHLADNIVRELLELARDENVYMTLVHDEDITASTEAPFSERLMMYVTSILNSIGIGMLGVSLGVSMRSDLAAMYAKYMTQVGNYGKEGLKIMMAKDWLEEPPQILDREKLAVHKH
ncbi:MAG TPA: hypothetical protein DCY27_01165 [Desulfobacterales bacterium]|nr:hypothetical protein [Desulfobacterales bacterium]